MQGVTGGEHLGTRQPPGQLVTVIGYPDNRDSALSPDIVALYQAAIAGP